MASRECAGKHLGSSCTGPPSILCGSCGAVGYCTPFHQRLHWIEHTHDCERWANQMRLGAVLHDFPFSFAQQSTFHIDKGMLTRCAFLESRGLHLLGLWKPECECRHIRPSVSGRENERLGWHLPPSMCPCKDFVPHKVDYGAYCDIWSISMVEVESSSIPFKCATNEMSYLGTWADYYTWRNLPLDSPVAILLHWPLTLYHSLKLVAARTPNYSRMSKGSLRIHYLGPEQELDQLEVFGELCALLPIQHIHVDFIGPAVPSSRDGHQIELRGFAECSDTDCECKSQIERDNIKSSVSLRLWKGLYHKIYRQLAKDVSPDFIFAPNAGIAAFPSWLPTLELIDAMKVPAVFTDFCEEATILASDCMKAARPCAVTIPMQINPFRQPITPLTKTLELPTYSNCFLFGIN